MKYCANCGCKLNDDDSFCLTCGAAVDQNTPIPQIINTKKKSRTGVAAVVAILLIVLCAAGFCVVKFTDLGSKLMNRNDIAAEEETSAEAAPTNETKPEEKQEENEKTNTQTEVKTRTETQAKNDVYEKFLELSGDIQLADKDYEKVIEEAESEGWSEIRCIPYMYNDVQFNDQYIPVYGVYTSEEYGDRVTIDWEGGYLTSADNMTATYEKLD